MKSLRVLIVDYLEYGCVGPNYFHGGTEIHTYFLCKVLSEMKIETHVIQSRYNDTDPSFNLPYINQHFITIGSKTNYKGTKRRWTTDCKKEVEILIRTLGDFDIAYNNYKARYSQILLNCGLNVVQPMHCTPGILGGRPGNVINTVLFAGSLNHPGFKFGYATEFVKEVYNRYNEKYVKFSYNTIWHPVGLSETTDEVLPQKDYLILIARSNPDKLPHIALEYAHKNRLKLKFFTTRAVSASTNYMEYYDKYIKKYESSDYIEIIENQNHSVIMEALKHARALVLTTKDDTFGIVALEAMERGVPIIYKKYSIGITPYDDIVSPEIRDLIKPAEDNIEFENLMCNLNCDYNERQSIAKYTRDKFSINVWKENILKQIDSFDRSKKPFTLF